MSNYDQLKSNGAKFWDSNPCGGNWSTYREFMQWIRKTEPYFFDILDTYTWQGLKIAEIGCGQGTTLNYLPSKGARMIGLDISWESVKQAYKGAEELGHIDRICVVQADAEKIPFLDSVFDRVISCGVLHHTVDTAGGIRNVYRILKPGGTAIIMLYHSGNPKWWMTNLIRWISKCIDRLAGREGVIAEKIRSKQRADSASGTALLELFGVPILKAFSNQQVRKMFSGFSKVKITNHQPGFRRMADILPGLKFLTGFLSWLDRVTIRFWGFYQVIEAEK